MTAPLHELNRHLTAALNAALDTVEQQRIELDRLRPMHEREDREFAGELAAEANSWPDATGGDQ